MSCKFWGYYLFLDDEFVSLSKTELQTETICNHVTSVFQRSCNKSHRSAHPGHSERRFDQTAERVVQRLWDGEEAAEHRVEQSAPLKLITPSGKRRMVCLSVLLFVMATATRQHNFREFKKPPFGAILLRLIQMKGGFVEMVRSRGIQLKFSL